MAKICLNMIVKNETAILERALNSVAPAIDCYVICDTGSSDGTPDLIRSVMERHGIPGIIPTFGFQNFAQARNQALQAARAADLDFDYLLLTDADMELVIDDLTFRDHLTEPLYTVRQESGLSYYNVRLVHRELAAEYVGVTHEYVSAPASQVKLEQIHFIDHANGANRVDKFERDIRLLTEDLQRDPNNARSLFYLAQSYRDLGQNQQAIDYYQRRVQVGGWDQETWYALYMIATLYRRMGDEPRFIQAAFDAYNFRPSRAEPLANLAEYFRSAGKHEACLAICDLGRGIPMTDDTLFVDRDAYGPAFERELGIAGFYSAIPERRERGRLACIQQTTSRSENAHWRWRSLNNATHYARRARQVFGSFTTKVVIVPPRPGYICMNPSILIEGDQRYCLVRTVNYRLDNGVYTILSDEEYVNTVNCVATLNESFDVISHREIDESADPGPIYPGGVQGIEDCRPFWFRGNPWLIATTRNRNHHQHNEMALLELDTEWRLKQIHLQRSYEAHRPQKNWMPFVRDDSIQFVYAMDPLTILRVDETTMQAAPISVATPPRALYLHRGGSQVIRVPKGWLMVIHETAEPGNNSERVYLHRFVLVDEHFAYLGMTEPFYFVRKGVEFCAGLAYDEATRRFVVSFGVTDSESWLGFIDEDALYAQIREW